MKLFLFAFLMFFICSNSFSQRRIYIAKDKSALIVLQDSVNAIWLMRDENWIMWSVILRYEIRKDTLVLNSKGLNDNRRLYDVFLMKSDSLISLKMTPIVYVKKKRIPKKLKRTLAQFPPLQE